MLVGPLALLVLDGPATLLLVALLLLERDAREGFDLLKLGTRETRTLRDPLLARHAERGCCCAEWGVGRTRSDLVPLDLAVDLDAYACSLRP